MAAPLTLDQLITEACEQFAPADNPTRYWQAALPHARAFRRKLLTNTSRESRIQILEVGNDRTVELPADYVQWERLGVLSGDEQFAYDLEYSDVVVPTSRPGYGAGWPHEWMRTGGFKIDRANHRVVCNSLVPEHTLLVLVYKSFDAQDGQDIPIDPLAHTWGVKYILAELHTQKENWAAADRAAAARDKEFGLYQQAIRTFTLANVRSAQHRAAAQRWK